MNRIIVILLVIAGVSFVPASSYASGLGDDGLHKVDWFTLSFKDVSEDIEQATSQRKRLVLIFEGRDCKYCEKLHKTHFVDPEIVSYLKENFQIIQYNLFGDEEVTDLDGEVLSEKNAAKKWGAKFTPYMLFMPDKVPVNSGDSISAGTVAVASMPGVYERSKFLNMFQWVKEKGYSGAESFKSYHERKLNN